MLGGAGLQPVTTATTVRLADGKPLVTDGPFADTKEVFGGYYLYECDNLDQATEMAARIPGAAARRDRRDPAGHGQGRPDPA